MERTELHELCVRLAEQAINDYRNWAPITQKERIVAAFEPVLWQREEDIATSNTRIKELETDCSHLTELWREAIHQKEQREELIRVLMETLQLEGT